MRIEYDTAHDLLNIAFLPNVHIDDSIEIDGVVIDYAKDKRIVAMKCSMLANERRAGLWTS